MKKLILVLFIGFSCFLFGQSDLGFEGYYVGDVGETHFKGELYPWAIVVKNLGNSDADKIDYKVVISEDQIFDEFDIILKEGVIAENWLNITGLDSGQSITHANVNKGPIKIPEEIEANKTYYIIFWLEQDITGGEIVISNNIEIQPIFIGLKNIVEIEEVIYLQIPDSHDYETTPVCPNITDPLGDRKPLLLVHGFQTDGTPALPKTSIWNNFIRYYCSDIALKQNYKLYYVKYSSNAVSIDDLGHELRIDLDNYLDFNGKQLTILAHSMGGLVSRSFAKRNITTGINANQKGGERVDRLITLGTPHHGNPAANGKIRLQVVENNFVGILDLALNVSELFVGTLFNSPPKHYEFNRSNLKWDNYDNLFDYNEYYNNPLIIPPKPIEENDWLNSIKMNGDPTNYFDDKIIAYGGKFTSMPYPDNIYAASELVLIDMGYLSDGVVPLVSSLFYNHPLNKRREFEGYFHDEIGKGRSEFEGLYGGLFHTIKSDLLETNLPVLISTLEEVEFPEVFINNSFQKILNISNTGSSILEISNIIFQGVDANQFSIVSPTVPTNINVNESQEIVVQFNPTSLGAKIATLEILNNSDNAPIKQINLTGIGGNEQPISESIVFTPNDAHDFGSVYIGGDIQMQTFQFTNNSAIDLNIHNISLDGVDADSFTIYNLPETPISDQNPLSFYSGENRFIYISFHPDTVGDKNVNLVISYYNPTTSSRNSPNFQPPEPPPGLKVIPLTGNGTNYYDNPNGNKIKAYEYWFDNNYTSKVSTSVASTTILNLDTDISTDNLETGQHILHIRFKDKLGQWSSVKSNFFYKKPILATGNNQITTYEYWFDDDFASHNSIDVTAEQTIVLNENISTSSLPIGQHILHIRFKDKIGQWSSVKSNFFYKLKPNLANNKIDAYRYWYNNNDATMVTEYVQTPVTQLDLNIDINPIVMPEGENFIHFQYRDLQGQWSSVLTNTFQISTYDNACVNKTTWNGSWNNGLPNNTTLAIINANYTTVTANLETCITKVNPNATLTITPSKYVKAIYNVVNEGTINIDAEGSFVQVEDSGKVEGSGVFSTKVNTTSLQDENRFTYFSSPSTLENLNVFAPWADMAYIWDFDGSTQHWSYIPQAIATTQLMEAGKGFAIQGGNEENPSQYPLIAETNFKNAFNNGIVTQTLYYNVGQQEVDATDDDSNLVGNPYPSAISSDDLIANNNISSVYIWTHNSELNQNATAEDTWVDNDYISCAIGTCSDPSFNRLIASGQGFFVTATTSGTLTFNNTLRRTTGNLQFRTPEDNDDKLWLSLTSNQNYTDQIAITFTGNGSVNLDTKFDALVNGNNYALGFYSINANNNHLSIDDRGLLNEGMIVPLGYYLNATTINNLTISLDQIERFEQMDIYLKDNLLHTTHDLKASSYTFDFIENGEFNNRFELQFNRNSLEINDQVVTERLIILNENETSIKIKAKGASKVFKIIIYDALGRVLANEKPNSSDFVLEIPSTYKGNIIFIKASFESGKIINTKFIKI